MQWCVGACSPPSSSNNNASASDKDARGPLWHLYETRRAVRYLRCKTLLVSSCSGLPCEWCMHITAFMVLITGQCPLVNGKLMDESIKPLLLQSPSVGTIVNNPTSLRVQSFLPYFLCLCQSDLKAHTDVERTRYYK